MEEARTEIGRTKDSQALSESLAKVDQELAQLLEKRRQLLDSGDGTDAVELNVALNNCSVQSLKLTLRLMDESGQIDSQNLVESITSLLQALEPVLERDDRPSELEHLWDAAFLVGVTTIAAAGVGAPLAALATHQPIGQKMLDEAIVTFTGVALAEAANEVRKHVKEHRSEVASVIPSITLPDGTVLNAADRLDPRNATREASASLGNELSHHDVAPPDIPDREIHGRGFDH